MQNVFSKAILFSDLVVIVPVKLATLALFKKTGVRTLGSGVTTLDHGVSTLGRG